MFFSRAGNGTPDMERFVWLCFIHVLNPNELKEVDL